MASIIPIIGASSSELCHLRHKCRPVATTWKQGSTLRAWQHGNCTLNYSHSKNLTQQKHAIIILVDYTYTKQLTLLKPRNKQMILFSSLHTMQSHISLPCLLLCFPHPHWICHRNQSSLISTMILNNANYWRQKFTFLHGLHDQFKWVHGRSYTLEVQVPPTNFKAWCLDCEEAVISCDMWSENCCSNM